MTNIPLSIKVKNPTLDALDRATPPIGWIIFHKKDFWLRLRFILYPFIMKFSMRIQLAPGQLLPNGWKYLLYLTFI